jgi:hypothetical protein
MTLTNAMPIESSNPFALQKPKVMPVLLFSVYGSQLGLNFIFARF